MARLQCHGCGFDGQVVPWVGELRCPSCGSVDVRAAIAVEGLTDAEVARIAGPVTDDQVGIPDGD